MQRTTSGRWLALALMATLFGTHAGSAGARADDAGAPAPKRDGAPDATDDKPQPKPKPKAAKPRSFAIAEVLHDTNGLGRMHVRCHSVAEPAPAEPKGKDKDKASEAAPANPMDKLQCAFFTATLAQRGPEKLATRENFAEILRDTAAQCRSARPRSEPIRKACAACRTAPQRDDCLYVEAMKELKRGACATSPSPHPNPAVRALEEADDARGTSASAVTAKFCAACIDAPSAACFSAFWHGIATPERCVVVTGALELTLARQAASMTWTGLLGGACSTQVALSYDEPRRTWTYRQLQLTPEKCDDLADRDARGPTQAVYSSAAKYAFADLTVMCARMSIR
jgi:hypothetical protein